MLKNLKNLRNETGLSQKQIAEKIHISQQTYSDYENCKTEPTGEMLIEIANFFEVSTDELLGREPTRTESFNKSYASREEYSEEEKKIIEEFRKAPKTTQDLFRRMFGITAEDKITKK